MEYLEDTLSWRLSFSMILMSDKQTKIVVGQRSLDNPTFATTNAGPLSVT